jgi:hypothetical protein
MAASRASNSRASASARSRSRCAASAASTDACSDRAACSVCCCCHYSPGGKFCAAGNADCFAVGPTLPGFMEQQLNCTEDPSDV